MTNAIRIHISAGPTRKKPQIGDRRTTKAHGLQIRVVQTYNGMWVRNGSRYCYEWVKIVELPERWRHLLTRAERMTYFPNDETALEAA